MARLPLFGDGPYRNSPDDIPYGTRIEASHCPWCRWEGKNIYWNDNGVHIHGKECTHPLQTNKVAPGFRCAGRALEWNHGGCCERYEASGWTRFLRKLGARLPAWRDSPDSDTG